MQRKIITFFRGFWSVNIVKTVLLAIITITVNPKAF